MQQLHIDTTALTLTVKTDKASVTQQCETLSDLTHFLCYKRFLSAVKVICGFDDYMLYVNGTCTNFVLDVHAKHLVSDVIKAHM